MPLILKHEDGLTCPQMQCDACGKIIADASRAILAWAETDNSRKAVKPRILHKGLCDDGQLEMSMELVTALEYLAHNLKIT